MDDVKWPQWAIKYLKYLKTASLESLSQGDAHMASEKPISLAEHNLWGWLLLASLFVEDFITVDVGVSNDGCPRDPSGISGIPDGNILSRL